MRFWNKSILFFIVSISGVFYLSPSNTSYFWNFGFLAFFFLLLQIITGIILAMFYNPSASLAYEIIMYINNEVYYGWWIRSLHANGASFFFFVVYLHMLRSIYYGSFVFPRQFLWVSGVIIWVLMIATAFLGYVLPWGQMSFWAAIVITNLLSAIPFIGTDLIYLLWGGFSISDVSLHRFYSLHFALPFILLFLSIIHVALLHEFGSNNILGLSIRTDMIPFTPYYILKDIFSLVIVLIVLLLIIFISPDLLGHTDNFNKANFLVTPPHIVPEWYFLPLYAVLRSVTHKFLGLMLLVFFVLSLALLPYISNFYLIRSSFFKPSNGLFFWFFVFDCVLLGWIGGLPIDNPYLLLGQCFTFFYFVFIYFFYQISNFVELLVYKSSVCYNNN